MNGDEEEDETGEQDRLYKKYYDDEEEEQSSGQEEVIHIIFNRIPLLSPAPSAFCRWTPLFLFPPTIPAPFSLSPFLIVVWPLADLLSAALKYVRNVQVPVSYWSETTTTWQVAEIPGGTGKGGEGEGGGNMGISE